MPKKKTTIEEAVEVPKAKLFFEDKDMPGWKVGDRFVSKGYVFEIKEITESGIRAVPI